ncbi:MAG: YdcF family protein [Caulobacterales bacterium]
MLTSIRKATDFAVHASFAIIAALVIGFVIYAQSAISARPSKSERDADGIVALTGDGGGRVHEALKLLQEGRAKRLLISGANPQATDRELAIAHDAPENLFDCCVDVGRSAQDTIGNAKETALWAENNDYKSLIIVTADFHMARSLTEIRMELPRTKLIAHPVQTLTAGKNWWRDGRTLRRLGVEYVKVVIANCRRVVDVLDPFDLGGK